MQLSRHMVTQINQAQVPSVTYFDLTEKVIQFGTGALLRGLPDYFIDKANKQGSFNGRIVIVKSTGSDVSDFESQDSLFTHRICGIEKGLQVTHNIINASISRVLSAQTHWNEILQCAANPEMQVVISNTTEVGIVLMEDNIHNAPPVSFPGKLLAFLFKRFTVFNGLADKGMVIVPTELITDNGTKLRGILLQIAHRSGLDNNFIDWLENCNHFCNSLVDRIVPGKLTPIQKQSFETEIGYKDDLMIISEPYSLWAIETNSDQVKEILAFYKTDCSVIIAPDITIFRELKLRLLNGTHTLSCGLAYLAGFNTVREAMDDKTFTSFMQSLMSDEISPAITSDILSKEEASDFTSRVLDRFRNPFIEHQWLNITLQYSSKMAMRNVPVIINYMQRFGKTPELMSSGFAGHILFMKCSKGEDGRYIGQRNGQAYFVNDDNAAFYAEAWQHKSAMEVVTMILANKKIWGTDLLLLNGFRDKVTCCLIELKKRYESIS